MTKFRFILLHLIAAFLLVGCGYTPRYARIEDCDPAMEALLIDKEALPAEWSQSFGPPNRNDEFSTGAIDHCIVSFHAFDSVGHEQVFKYNTEEAASDDYVRLEDYFGYGWDAIPFTFDEEIGADEYRVECGSPMDTPMCNLVARYGTYVVEFNIHRSPDYMTDEDLRQAILAIDEKMTQKRE